MKNIIISADDLNHSEIINKGIHLAAETGLITSTSVIVNRSCLSSTLEIIKKFPRLSIGLHFNLSRYKPLVSINRIQSLLFKEAFGFGGSRNAFYSRALKFEKSEIYEELYAQYRRFIDLFSQPPTHIDSHHYIHSVLPVCIVVADFCNVKKLPMRRAERVGCQHNIYKEYVFTTDALYWVKKDSLSFLQKQIIQTSYKSIELVCHLKLNIMQNNSNERLGDVFEILKKLTHMIKLKNNNIHLTNYRLINLNNA